MRQTKTNTIATNVSTIPDTALEALARCLLPAIRSYFESEEGRREFGEWKLRQGQPPQQPLSGIENLPSREVEPDNESLRLAG